MNIAVIGAGQMGAGIAQVMAVAGHTTVLIDAFPSAIAQAKVGIARRLDRAVEKQQLREEDRAAVLARLHFSQDIVDCRAFGVAMVIEAIPEKAPLKTELFARLDDILPREVILATNTSSISITHIAASTTRPALVAGMHFMHPVPVMSLVEVVRGVNTNDETVATIVGLAEAVGKTAVVVDDQPGFVANRILMPMINEAICALSDGVADAAGIDTIMQLGMNHPMGPLTLADFIGLDTCLSIMETLADGFGDPKYRPAPLLRRYVTAGRLGRKARQGFFTYNERGEKIPT
jgi:3-hydroxybutyryl-CoA dehydrogenase